MAKQRQTLGGCLLAAATSLALMASAAPARAQAASSEALVETRRADAKRQFEGGVEHYRAGRYGQAVSAFLEADQLAPSPSLSFNIARAYERLDDTSGALRWYRDYLRRSPNAQNAADVKARISALAAKLALGGVQQLTVLSTPSGAKVMVDGRAMGLTPFTGELAPGKHRVLLDLGGYQEVSSEVLLSPRLPSELSLTLQPRTQPVAPSAAPAFAPAPASDDGAGQRRFGVLPWLVAGTGVIGLGGALGFELARRADERAARQAQNQLEYQDKLGDVERNQTRARVLVGVGGGLFVTGGVMLLFNQRAKEPTRVGLGCTPHGCTASANGSF